jgi:hypothetical protein
MFTIGGSTGNILGNAAIDLGLHSIPLHSCQVNGPKVAKFLDR